MVNTFSGPLSSLRRRRHSTCTPRHRGSRHPASSCRWCGPPADIPAPPAILARASFENETPVRFPGLASLVLVGWLVGFPEGASASQPNDRPAAAENSKGHDRSPGGKAETEEGSRRPGGDKTKPQQAPANPPCSSLQILEAGRREFVCSPPSSWRMMAEVSDNAKGLALAVASSAFIGVSFILKKIGLLRAAKCGARAGTPPQIINLLQNALVLSYARCLSACALLPALPRIRGLLNPLIDQFIPSPPCRSEPAILHTFHSSDLIRANSAEPADFPNPAASSDTSQLYRLLLSSIQLQRAGLTRWRLDPGDYIAT